MKPNYKPSSGKPIRTDRGTYLHSDGWECPGLYKTSQCKWVGKQKKKKQQNHNPYVDYRHDSFDSIELFPGLPITGAGNGKHWIPDPSGRGMYKWNGTGNAPVGWSWGINCEDGNNSFSADCGEVPAGPGNPCTDDWDGQQLSCTKLACPECPGEAHFHVTSGGPGNGGNQNHNVNWQHPADPTPKLYPGLPITGNKSDRPGVPGVIGGDVVTIDPGMISGPQRPSRVGYGECFVGGTKVIMQNGPDKNIEDIEIGEEVLSYNVHTENFEIKKVINIFTQTHNLKDGDITVKIKFSNGVVTHNTIANPFWSKDKGFVAVDEERCNRVHEWVIASNGNMLIESLGISDILYHYNGDDGILDEVTVEDITYVLDKDIRTYDIEVEDNHTFFANGILTHNSDTTGWGTPGPPSPPPPPPPPPPGSSSGEYRCAGGGFAAKCVCNGDFDVPGPGEESYCEEQNCFWDESLGKMQFWNMQILQYNQGNQDISIYPPYSAEYEFFSEQGNAGFYDVCGLLRTEKHCNAGTMLDYTDNWFGTSPYYGEHGTPSSGTWQNISNSVATQILYNFSPFSSGDYSDSHDMGQTGFLHLVPQPINFNVSPPQGTAGSYNGAPPHPPNWWFDDMGNEAGYVTGGQWSGNPHQWSPSVTTQIYNDYNNHLFGCVWSYWAT